MSAHISSVCKSVRYYLRNLGILPEIFDLVQLLKKIVHAFISSRFDFGNAHFFQLPPISTLQGYKDYKNAAARLIMLSKLKDHITPILYSLHWLPVEFRINIQTCITGFFIACMVLPPEYNISIIKEYDPPRCLRSSNTGSTCHSKSSYCLGGSILRTCWTISLEWIAYEC